MVYQGASTGPGPGEEGEGEEERKEGDEGSFISVRTRVTNCFSLPGTKGAGSLSLKTEGVLGKRGRLVPYVESWGLLGPESVPASQLP